MADASALRAKLEEWATLVHAEAVDRTVEALRDAAPFASGETRREIHDVPQSSGIVLRSQVVSPTPQGQWVEEGTEPHLIEPVSARVLVFPGDGGLVFAAHVDHPGTEARPWFHPTLEERWPAELETAAGLFGF